MHSNAIQYSSIQFNMHNSTHHIIDIFELECSAASISSWIRSDSVWSLNVTKPHAKLIYVKLLKKTHIPMDIEMRKSYGKKVFYHNHYTGLSWCWKKVDKLIFIFECAMSIYICINLFRLDIVYLHFVKFGV